MTEMVAQGLAFPETPMLLPDGDLIFAEIAGQKVTRLRPNGTLETVVQVDGAVNGLAMGPDGWIYACDNGNGFKWHKDARGFHVVGPPPTGSAGASCASAPTAAGWKPCMTARATARF